MAPFREAPETEGLVHFTDPVVQVVLLAHELARILKRQGDVRFAIPVNFLEGHGIAFRSPKIPGESKEATIGRETLEIGLQSLAIVRFECLLVIVDRPSPRSSFISTC